MADDRRLTTSRLYGGTEDRLDILHALVTYVDTKTPTEDQLIEWIISETKATSPGSIKDRLAFLRGIDLLTQRDDTYTLGTHGQQYLETEEPATIYDALTANVKGFDTILEALADGPMTDQELMDLFVDTFENAEMGTPGPVVRHREWLQALGYARRSDGKTHLTAAGKELLSETTPTAGPTAQDVLSPLTVDTPSPGQDFTQDTIEEWFDTKFGYQISGINPRRDADGNRYILLFAQADGPYDDSIGGEQFQYIGEGMPEKGDQDPDSPGNSVLIEAITDPVPIFFFHKKPNASTWRYEGLVDVQDWDWQTNPTHDREEIVFDMRLLTDTSTELTTTAGEDESPTTLENSLYLIPVSEDWYPDFERCVLSTLTLELAADVPDELRTLNPDHIWGTTTSTSDRKESHAAAMASGDHLLFYHQGEFIAQAVVDTTLENPAIGDFLWDNPESRYIFTLRSVSESPPPIQRVWTELGYDGKPVVPGFQRVAAERLDGLSQETVARLRS